MVRPPPLSLPPSLPNTLCNVVTCEIPRLSYLLCHLASSNVRHLCEPEHQEDVVPRCNITTMTINSHLSAPSSQHTHPTFLRPTAIGVVHGYYMPTYPLPLAISSSLKKPRRGFREKRRVLFTDDKTTDQS